MTVDIRRLAGRARVAMRETGALGLVRRTARAALGVARDALDDAAESLFYIEAEKRIPADERALLARNRALADSHRGQRCFVLATGPSVSSCDLTLLAPEITVSVNGFFRHPIVASWQPTYHCLMDHAFYDDPVSSDAFFAEVRRTIPRSELFVVSQFHRVIAERGWFPLDRIHHVAMDGRLGDRALDTLDFTRVVPAASNALQFAVAVAVFLGCSPIYVLGADHDWLARKPDAASPNYFYQGPLLSRAPRADDPDPFTPSGAPWPGRYDAAMAFCVRLWRGYRVLAEYAEKRGQRIVTVGDASFLDVFPRASYEEALRRPLRAMDDVLVTTRW